MEQGTFKDLEEVSLKATYDIELGNRLIHEGEVIAYFDRIQVAGLNEMQSYVSAHGGYGDRDLVFWNTTQEIQLSFSQGVMKKDQFAFMVNAKLIDKAEEDIIFVSKREFLESDEDRWIECAHTPVQNIFIYDKQTGAALEYIREGNRFRVAQPFQEVIIDYEFAYTGGGELFQIGQRVLNGFVSLEGKTRLKDDTTGQVVTGVIKIPKLKVMSDLSMRLGAQATPYVGTFKAVGVPVGSRGDSYVCQFYWLHDDINSDL